MTTRDHKSSLVHGYLYISCPLITLVHILKILWAMSTLSDSIKDLYEDISAEETTLAANNLITLFKILESIDARLARTKESNEPKNENIRSSH